MLIVVLIILAAAVIAVLWLMDQSRNLATCGPHGIFTVYNHRGRTCCRRCCGSTPPFQSCEVSKMRNILFGTFLAALLVAAAISVSAQTPYENTIDCASFRKLPDGKWYAGAATTLSIGGARMEVTTSQNFGPHSFNLGGSDVYGAIERKCGTPYVNTIDCASFRKRPNGKWYVGEDTTLSIGGATLEVTTNQNFGPHSFNLGGNDVYGAIERKCGTSPKKLHSPQPG